MKCIIIDFGTYRVNWNFEEPKPVLEQGFLKWPEHKFEIGYCTRCGAKETK